MAYVYTGINRGAAMYQAITASSTPGKDVEVVVNLANMPDRQSVITALTNIQDFILQNNWPPF